MSVRLRSSSKTSAETVLAIQLAAANFPFLREVEYAPPRKLRADFLVRHCDALACRLRVLVEVTGGVYDGRAHGSIKGILADIDRLNEASCAGMFMLRLTPQMVDEGMAIPLIERFFARQATTNDSSPASGRT